MWVQLNYRYYKREKSHKIKRNKYFNFSTLDEDTAVFYLDTSLLLNTD